MFSKKLADRYCPEERLQLGNPLVESLMQRAEMISMAIKPQRTAFDTFQGVDGVDDLQNGKLLQRTGQDKAPVEPSL